MLTGRTWPSKPSIPTLRSPTDVTKTFSRKNTVIWELGDLAQTLAGDVIRCKARWMLPQRSKKKMLLNSSSKLIIGKLRRQEARWRQTLSNRRDQTAKHWFSPWTSIRFCFCPLLLIARCSIVGNFQSKIFAFIFVTLMTLWCVYGQKLHQEEGATKSPNITETADGKFREYSPDQGSYLVW